MPELDHVDAVFRATDRYGALAEVLGVGNKGVGFRPDVIVEVFTMCGDQFGYVISAEIDNQPAGQEACAAVLDDMFRKRSELAVNDVVTPSGGSCAAW
jgi:hypothetical protein